MFKCKYNEIRDNLFSKQTDDAITHSVSKDLKMRAAI